MHLTLQKSDLLRVLDLACTFKDREPPKPILRNALLSVVEAGEHQLLRVTASDLLQTLTVHASCAAEELGAVALSARALHEVVGTLPEGPVELREEGTRVEVRSGRRVARIPFEVAHEFPSVPALDESSAVTLGASAIVSLFERTRRCGNGDPTRLERSSILLEIGDGEARAVALDGRAMAVAREPFRGEHGRVAGVPIKAATRLLAALQKHEGQVTVGFATHEDGRSGDLVFRFGAVEFATKPVERDRYPNFEELLDANRPHRIAIATKALLDSISAARKVLNGDELPNATFSLSGGELEVSIVSSSGRTYTDAICGVEHAQPYRWGMNIDLLTDALEPVTADVVELRYLDNLKPFEVIVPDNDSYKAVVSPCHM